MNTPQIPKMIAVAASVQGYSHKLKGVENQDSFGYLIDEEKQLIVAVVSDGAGSAKYSKTGSSLCVQHLTQDLMQLALDTIKSPNDRYIPAIKHIISTHIDSFRHITDQTKQFNHTINVVIYSPLYGGKIIQIGDSPTLVVCSDQQDFAKSAIFEENKQSEYANQTVFFSHQNWEQYLRIKELPPAVPLAIFMMTDGPATVFFEKEKLPLNQVVKRIKSLKKKLDKDTVAEYYQLKAIEKALLAAPKYANLWTLKAVADEMSTIDKIDTKWLNEFQLKINEPLQQLKNGKIENNVAEHIIIPVASVNKLNELMQKLNSAQYIDQALTDFLEADEFCESTGDDKTILAYFPENWLSSTYQYSPNYKTNNIVIDENIIKNNQLQNKLIITNTPKNKVSPSCNVNKKDLAERSDPNSFEKNKNAMDESKHSPEYQTVKKKYTKIKEKIVDDLPINHEENNSNDEILPPKMLERAIIAIFAVVGVVLLLGIWKLAGKKEEVEIPPVPTASIVPQQQTNTQPKNTQTTTTEKGIYEKAAEGDADAQYTVGKNFEQGLDGKEIDVNKALEWYQKAAAQGHKQAQQQLEKIKPK